LTERRKELEEMSDSWLDSIVLVESSDQAIQGFGTGFPIYWDGRATYFVTCAHVVRDAGGQTE
jgi:hypothetical protein